MPFEALADAAITAAATLVTFHAVGLSFIDLKPQHIIEESMGPITADTTAAVTTTTATATAAGTAVLPYSFEDRFVIRNQYHCVDAGSAIPMDPTALPPAVQTTLRYALDARCTYTPSSDPALC
jgi:hypothetical protein